MSAQKGPSWKDRCEIWIQLATFLLACIAAFGAVTDFVVNFRKPLLEEKRRVAATTADLASELYHRNLQPDNADRNRLITAAEQLRTITFGMGREIFDPETNAAIQAYSALFNDDGMKKNSVPIETLDRDNLVVQEALWAFYRKQYVLNNAFGS